MVPVLWDTGGDIARREPYAFTPELTETLAGLNEVTSPAKARK